MPTVRLFHISDIHLTAKPLGWKPRDLLSKRATGWLNLRLFGRGRRFHNAPTVTAAVIQAVRQQTPDALIFSGDATSLGFESELYAATQALEVNDTSLPPALAVPGNHDYYTRRAVRSGLFEKYFSPWQIGERVGEEAYPFARQVNGVWLIGVNSAKPNRWNWDATGRIGLPQLDRLRRLCARLDDAPKILVTHYPLRTAAREVEPRVRRLRDHKAALHTARDCGIILWLHGHIHKPFVLAPCSEIPFALCCAGSTTQNNRWGYAEYQLDGNRLNTCRWQYDPGHNSFTQGPVTSIELGT